MTLRCMTLLGLLSLFSLLLVGCSPPPNVSLKPDFWKDHQHTVMVKRAKIGKPQLYKQGAQGLFDIAINAAVMSHFDDYLAHTSNDWYQQLQQQFVTGLEQKHILVKHDDVPLNMHKLESFGKDTKLYAVKNYHALAIHIASDRLLNIDATQVGAVRFYYGFIPLGAPQATCHLVGRLVDLHSNRILWRFNTSAVVPVDGDWDQEPHYPNFDRALKKAVKQASEQLLNNFFIATKKQV